MKQVAVIKHVAFEDLGTLAIALKQNNYVITDIEAGIFLVMLSVWQKSLWHPLEQQTVH